MARMNRVSHGSLSPLYGTLHNARFSQQNHEAISYPLDQITPLEETSNDIACAYSQAGQGYSAYADGNSDDIFAFEGIHAYTDRIVWARLESILRDLRDTGATSVRILDAGCGPGIWLRRMVLRACELGFTTIEARGFDIAREQIRRARFLSQDLLRLPGVTLAFDVADLSRPFSEADGSVDVALCLYSVLSHLPVKRMESVAAEISRVTCGTFITTVRPLGSPPTAFVDSIDKARSFQHDADADKFKIIFDDGRNLSLDVHLFSAAELEKLFSSYFAVKEISGLDLFHGRFVPDPRWTPTSFHIEDRLIEHLDRLEEAFAADPVFLNCATHLLLVGTKRSVKFSEALCNISEEHIKHRNFC